MKIRIGLFVILLLNIFTSGAQVFEYTYKGQTLNYEVVGYAHVKTFVNNNVSGDVKIPSIVRFDYKNYWVIAIDNHAFANCKNLTSIEIPRSVLTIGEEAFAQCENLQKVKIPLHVTKIQKGTFLNCKNLKKVELCKNVTLIEKAAFYGCENLEEIKMPNSVRNIEVSAFRKCKKLSTFPISNSLEEVRDYAFAECESLSQIKFPFSTEYIGANAFSGCTNLQSIQLKKNIVCIGDSAFIKCPKLENVKIKKRSPFYGEEPCNIKNGGTALKNNCIEKSYQEYMSDLMSNGETKFFTTSKNPIQKDLGNVKKIKNLKAIYVPESSIDKYKTAEGWSEYKEIIMSLDEFRKDDY